MTISFDDATDMQIIESVKAICSSMKPSPLNIFCSISGVRIGTLDDHAIWQVIQAYPRSRSYDNLDNMVEELRQSCMLSMRPSPAWTQQSPKRLKELIKRDPVGACVYFLTRAYHQNNRSALSRDPNLGDGINWRKWESKYAQAEFNWERVQLADYLYGRDIKTVERLALLLCEIDALAGLHTIATVSKFLDSVLNEESFNSLIKHYSGWRDKLIERRAKQHLDSAKANKLASGAFNYIRPESQEPTKRQLKLAEKAKQTAEFNDIWNSINNIETKEQAADMRHTLESGKLPDMSQAQTRPKIKMSPKLIKTSGKLNLDIVRK